MENSKKEKLESKLEKLKSEIDAKYNVYLNKRSQIIEEIRTIEADEAKAAVGETYYEKLVHVTSTCNNGHVEHFIGVIDANTVNESSFRFKGGVTHIVMDGGEVYGCEYNEGGWLKVNAYTNELFRLGKTTYRDINPRFHHDVEIRGTTKEDEEEFVNSAYNEKLLALSNKIRLENEKSISAMRMQMCKKG